VFRPISGDPYIPRWSLKRIEEEINSFGWLIPTAECPIVIPFRTVNSVGVFELEIVAQRI
jgi:hypothetical protein